MLTRDEYSKMETAVAVADTYFSDVATAQAVYTAHCDALGGMTGVWGQLIELADLLETELSAAWNDESRAFLDDIITLVPQCAALFLKHGHIPRDIVLELIHPKPVLSTLDHLRRVVGLAVQSDIAFSPLVVAARVHLDANDTKPQAPGPQVVLCARCGSDRITSDASAEWCPEAQAWKLAGVQDNCTCNDCGWDGDHPLVVSPSDVEATRERLQPF